MLKKFAKCLKKDKQFMKCFASFQKECVAMCSDTSLPPSENPVLHKTIVDGVALMVTITHQLLQTLLKDEKKPKSKKKKEK